MPDDDEILDDTSESGMDDLFDDPDAPCPDCGEPDCSGECEDMPPDEEDEDFEDDEQEDFDYEEDEEDDEEA